MIDLTTLRDAWGEPEPPSHTTFAKARMALLERVATPPTRTRRRPRLPRMGVRLAAVGAMALALAIGATVVQISGGTDANGRRQSIVPGIPVAAANAQQVLERAAVAAESRPFTAPRPDQWIYTENRRIEIRPGDAGTPSKNEITSVWAQADGKRVAFFESGKLEVSLTGGGRPPSDYPTLAALPTDPDTLLDWVYRDWVGPRPGDGRHATAFQMLSGVLRANLLPPKVEAAIFRAIKKIPGVSLAEGTADAAGRPALRLTRVIEGWVQLEVLLDPRTYAYLGARDFVIKDHDMALNEGRGPIVKKGTVLFLEVNISKGIVDKPGQRP